MVSRRCGSPIRIRPSSRSSTTSAITAAGTHASLRPVSTCRSAVRARDPSLRGADSKILSVAVAERVIREMQHAELVEIPRATHNVHSDNPVDFAAALGEFLGRHV